MVRGGKRKGAGRKPDSDDPRFQKVKFGTTLPAWLKEAVDQHEEPNNKMIEHSLIKTYKFEGSKNGPDNTKHIKNGRGNKGS